MSQFPSPYSPPQLPYQNAPAPGINAISGPAKKAAILLFILGGLGAAMGLCMGSMVWVIPNEQMQPFIAQILHGRDTPLNGITPEQFVRVCYTVVGVIFLAISGALLLFGYFVRRSSKRAAVAGIIFTGLATVYFTFGVLLGARQGSHGDMLALSSACLSLVPLALFALVTLWLAQLLRELPGLKAAQREYQAQYYQSQQQQLNYNANPSGMPGRGGYGGYPQTSNTGQTPGAPPSQGYAMPQQTGSGLSPQGNAPAEPKNDEPPPGAGY